MIDEAFAGYTDELCANMVEAFYAGPANEGLTDEQIEDFRGGYESGWGNEFGA